MYNMKNDNDDDNDDGYHYIINYGLQIVYIGGCTAHVFYVIITAIHSISVAGENAVRDLIV